MKRRYIIMVNKNLNFFEKLYCGWLHIIWIFLLWKEIVFTTDGSQSWIFFAIIESDYINYIELTWWRSGRYKKF
jgi:hypothetical protein